SGGRPGCRRSKSKRARTRPRSRCGGGCLCRSRTRWASGGAAGSPRGCETSAPPMSPRPIEARGPRKDYEHRIAPRSLLRVLSQKTLHQWARVCIPPGLRLALYRAMGITIGHGVFVGLDTWLDDQFPELIVIEDEVVISFRVTIVVHDDARRMDAILPGQ